MRGALALLEATVAADERAIARAEKLRRFFGQPFFVAEPYTHRPGVIVLAQVAGRICREILDGVHDDVPTEAFFFTGGIEEIRAQGKSLAVTSREPRTSSALCLRLRRGCGAGSFNNGELARLAVADWALEEDDMQTKEKSWPVSRSNSVWAASPIRRRHRRGNRR